MVTTDQLGRVMIQKFNARKPIGFIILTYPSRALEWICLRKVFAECLIKFDMEHMVPCIADVMFAWKYHDKLSSTFYRPSEVFKKFSFLHLLDENDHCACLHAKRLSRFLDPQTSNETSSFAAAQVHVRSVDINLIQHQELRKALSMGLNHIPLKPTCIAVSIACILDAFMQLVHILKLEQLGLPTRDASEWIRSTCLAQLKTAARTNRSGLRHSGQDLLSQTAVQNEIQWILSNLYCSGLDKASNNVCFVCIKHIRLLALERLSCQDFSPCKVEQTWVLQTHILDQVAEEINELVPQLQISSMALPYLMATYKLHKQKYRWLTNAFQTVFSNLAHMLTLATMAVLDQVRDWAKNTMMGYSNFLSCSTSIFWLVNSSIEVALNLPEKIQEVFVADITRCYETIPLHGPDNLVDAVAHIIKIGFRQAKSAHARSIPKIWIRVDTDGKAARACWNTTCPAYGTWFALTEEKLVDLHAWLMRNCYIALGDRVWRQQAGIPMGFSCSPLWCNTYLLHYEIGFIQRLARLGRTDLMQKFRFAFRYIDDLCWVNTAAPMDFLSPQQARLESNPYWIYPLNVLEIKSEVSKYSQLDPLKGILANFMNLEIRVSESEPTAYRIRKFDKRRTLPFSYTQYIKFRSNRPIKQSYSIAVSQSVPILYISNSVEAATEEIQILIATLVSNGFYEPRLRRTISEFLSKNQFPGLKFDILQLCSNLL